MYFPATKVKVITSSVTKGKAALKKGSLGYAINLGGIYADKKAFTTTTIPYTMCPGHMLVTRFGNEKTRRLEIKPVVYVIPIQKDKVQKFKTAKAIVDDAKRFTGQLLTLWKEAGRPVKSLPFIIAIPAIKELDVTISNNELKAWTYSFFASDLLKPILNSQDAGYGALLKKNLKQYLPSNQYTDLTTFFRHPKEVYKLVDSLEDKQNFILFLQSLRNAYINNYLINGYNINGTSVEISNSLKFSKNIDKNTTDILGLWNIKNNNIIQNCIVFSWLTLCYNINAYKGGPAYIPKVQKHISDWLNIITTAK